MEEQMYTRTHPTLRLETVVCKDEEESPCSEDMHLSESLESSANVNYDDINDYVMVHLKKEFPEDDFPQSDSNMNCKLVFENSELINLIENQEIKHEHLEERPSSNIKVECEDIEFQFAIKTDRLEQQPATSDKAVDAGTTYVSKTPQEEDFLLFQDLEQFVNVICQYCKHKYELMNHMKLCRTGKEAEYLKYKCDLCERIYIKKQTLPTHMNNTEHDYGKMYKCSCGKHFRGPIEWSEHECYKKQHVVKRTNESNEGYTCVLCEAVFTLKYSLSRHIKRFHYDYGRTFECSCGHVFLTPIQLTQHNKIWHHYKIKVYKCKYCESLFMKNCYLTRHIKNVHDLYGIYRCWCGREFLTPTHFIEHNDRMHAYVHNGFKFIFSHGKKGEY